MDEDGHGRELPLTQERRTGALQRRERVQDAVADKRGISGLQSEQDHGAKHSTIMIVVTCLQMATVEDWSVLTGTCSPSFASAKSSRLSPGM
jgi:hypothetical protein